MALEKITFPSTSSSLAQIGDNVYWCSNEFNVMSEPIFAGVIWGIHPNAITVDVVNVGAIPVDSFIVFEKNIKVNESGIKGYYADITMENHSKTYAELFAISSEVVPSSK
jgi:hypothetical protein